MLKLLNHILILPAGTLKPASHTQPILTPPSLFLSIPSGALKTDEYSPHRRINSTDTDPQTTTMPYKVNHSEQNIASTLLIYIEHPAAHNREIGDMNMQCSSSGILGLIHQLGCNTQPQP
jgi:hypothetical protein